MGKRAIVYYSQHHGNTKKLLDAIAGFDTVLSLFFIPTFKWNKILIDIDKWGKGGDNHAISYKSL